MQQQTIVHAERRATISADLRPYTDVTSTIKTVPPTVISSATSDNLSAEKAVRNTSMVISDQPEPRIIYFILYGRLVVFVF